MPPLPEEVLLPSLQIVDPHHHLRDRVGHSYMPGDFLADIGTGHRIVATVAVETGARYRTDGPPGLSPVGETEFLSALAREAADTPEPRLNAGIVGFADLRLGSRAEPVLAAHVAAGDGRFRGIRYPVAWHEHPELKYVRSEVIPGVLGDEQFRAGFTCLARFDLSFDAWVYHPQLPELADLARAFPGTRIVLDHLGGPLGLGPYRGRRDEVFADWSARMRDLAALPNMFVKLGGLGMPIIGLPFAGRAERPTSEELAEAWRPYIEHAIDLFGPERSMFESNFPPDKVSCGYRELWNAFKRITAAASADERTALFSGTARAVYRL